MILKYLDCFRVSRLGSLLCFYFSDLRTYAPTVAFTRAMFLLMTAPLRRGFSFAPQLAEELEGKPRRRATLGGALGGK